MTRIAEYYININGRMLWFETESLINNTAEGFDGDDEQCEECGTPISETNYSFRDGYGHRNVRCACGAEYLIHNSHGGVIVS